LFSLGGCATSMRMDTLEGPRDTTMVGRMKVRVVDLDASKPSTLLRRTPGIPADLLLRADSAYRIGPLDALIVTVWEHPELTQPLGQYRNDIASGQLVDADGSLYFPYLGRVQVVGLTAREVQKLVTDALSKVLRDPQVDIKVSAYRSKRIYVSGEVRNPGVVPIDDIPMTLPEALNRVGGILPTGDGSAVRLTRGDKVYTLDVEGLQRAGAPLSKIQLLPGDQIRVQNSEESVAYILGEVQRPSLLRLTNGRMSLLHAITESGGYNDLTANSAGVYVVRAEDSTRTTVYRLDGRSPVALAWAGQFQLQARDLVYVDQSGLSRWNKVFQLLVPMSTVLNGATGAAVNVQTLESQPW